MKSMGGNALQVCSSFMYMYEYTFFLRDRRLIEINDAADDIGVGFVREVVIG